MYKLSLWTVALRSARYFVRSNAALAFGFAAATAVLVGALVVGDSVSGSLRKLVVDRLANIECLLQSRSFFNPTILMSLGTESGESAIVPGMLFSSSTVERRTDQGVTRASRVQVLAFDQGFWETVTLSDKPPRLAEDEVALNASLAAELQVAVGDEIAVRVEQLTSVSGDNPLGNRDDTSINVPRQRVVAILADDSVGGVSFLSGQATARNVFLSLKTLQDVLDVDDQVNAAIVLNVDRDSTNRDSSRQWCDALNLQLMPSLEDYGLKLERHRRIFPDEPLDSPPVAGLPPEVVFDYLQLTSHELILDNPTIAAVTNQFERNKANRQITYLANSIAKIEPQQTDMKLRNRANADAALGPESAGGPMRRSVAQLDPAESTIVTSLNPGDEPNEISARGLPVLSREVPYSIVVGAEPASELNLPAYTEVPRDELFRPYCWVNSWLAEELSVSAGDWLQIKFFEPETVDGREVEKVKRLMVAGVVPLTEPAKGYSRRLPASYATAPTIFNDPGLTPTVPGVTDQESISNWDVPFKLENPLAAADDEYWDNHRLTPKLFLPFDIASNQDYFGSRFGTATAIRFSSELSKQEQELRSGIEQALLTTRGLRGLSFRPVREQLLSSASGTTPFDQLFLALSFFVIVAALLLVYLLFKLAIGQRTSELGILLAQGFSPARVRRLLLTEMSLVGIAGACLGIGLGIGYAKVIIAGLESWWIGAISTSFLTFFADTDSLVIGALAGFLAGLFSVFMALRRASKQNALSVLRGQIDETAGQQRTRFGHISLVVAGFAAFAAAGLILLALNQTGMARAGSFFGSGMLLLIASLSAIRYLIHQGREGEHSVLGGSLWRLAWKAVCRNPARSSLSLGLLAVATFLISSMSVFQIAPSQKGYGGFNLIAESSQPVYRNIGSNRVRRELLGDSAQALQASTIVPLRSRNGEDASCNNLFQVGQPTVIGVSLQLQELHALAPTSIEFEWSRTATPENPWEALRSAASGGADDPIPVILDQNTADWSLKQGGSLGAVTRLDFDNGPVYFRTVGLLANSIFQGKLLVNQENFERLFPKIGGYNFFLIRTVESQDPQQVSQTLEEGWSTEGMDVMQSSEVLARYLGVQNTYISAFQSLGALGLLLGTFGLVAVQLRSVLERRREFALMQAVGFAPSRIAKILTAETAILLGGGLLIGTLCAAAALVPYVIEVGPELSLLNSLAMLLVVLTVGFLAALIAVRAATKLSVLEGLRSE